MAYIGPQPKLGQNREVDDISSGFNGSTTAFTLQVGGSNASPGSANNIIVSVNSVVLNPNTAYTVNGSTITFTSAPTNGHAFFGLILGQGIDSGEVSNGSVSTAKLADDAVTSAKIADNAVVTAAINADAVTAAKLADNAVVRANISDDAVNADKITAGGVDTNALGSDSVTTVKILNANVTTDKLADNAVTTAKIADDNVTQAKIAAGAIGTTELSNNAVTTAKILDDNVTQAKIAAGAIGTTELSNNAVTGAKITDGTINADDKISNSSITTIKIANDAITGAKLGDNAVATANIGDGQVTAAKLASGVGGKILQVVQGTLDGTFSSTSTSFVNIGLSAAITPASSSNKVLVLAMLNFGSDNNGNRLIIRLVRTGDDNILSGTGSGSRTRASAQYATTDDGDMNNVNLTHLDSPSTTSSTTYQVQCKVQSSSGTIKFGASGGDGNSSIEARTPQRIVLLEVGA